jgi:hypothetical protein
MFNEMNCSMVSPSTFFLLQKNFIFPAIEYVWKSQQENMLSLLQAFDEPLSL